MQFPESLERAVDEPASASDWGSPAVCALEGDEPHHCTGQNCRQFNLDDLPVVIDDDCTNHMPITRHC